MTLQVFIPLELPEERNDLARANKLVYDLPKLALPKKRFALVDEGGGGGFWICDAVGARDWRML